MTCDNPTPEASIEALRAYLAGCIGDPPPAATRGALIAAVKRRLREMAASGSVCAFGDVAVRQDGDVFTVDVEVYDPGLAAMLCGAGWKMKGGGDV